MQISPDACGDDGSFYRMGDFETYKIASIQRKWPAQEIRDGYTLTPLRDMREVKGAFDFAAWQTHVPYKDAACFSHRYFAHPRYRYDVFGIQDEKNVCRALLILREIEQNGRQMAKIIDYIGEDAAIGQSGSAIGALMEQRGYEYMDMYSTGIANETMAVAGFHMLDEEDPNCIPHFFEPFEQRNIAIEYYAMLDEGLQPAQLRLF